MENLFWRPPKGWSMDIFQVPQSPPLHVSWICVIADGGRNGTPPPRRLPSDLLLSPLPKLQLGVFIFTKAEAPQECQSAILSRCPAKWAYCTGSAHFALGGMWSVPVAGSFSSAFAHFSFCLSLKNASPASFLSWPLTFYLIQSPWVISNSMTASASSPRQTAESPHRPQATCTYMPSCPLTGATRLIASRPPSTQHTAEHPRPATCSVELRPAAIGSSLWRSFK